MCENVMLDNRRWVMGNTDKATGILKAKMSVKCPYGKTGNILENHNILFQKTLRWIKTENIYKRKIQKEY